MSSLKDTIEKIKNLEAEKRNLLTEIDTLKRMAEARATTLESEVGNLREEVKSLKVLVAGPAPEPPTPNKLQL